MTPQEEVLRLLAEALATLAKAPVGATHTVTVTASASLGWTPERFWSAPDVTQIDAVDLAAALNVGRAAIYKLVKRSGLPCRRQLDAKGKTVLLAFRVGDVKRWLDQRQEVVNPVPMRLAPASPRKDR